MAYEPKNYERLLGTPGFSDQLLKNHFALYQGYVTNTNKLMDVFREMTEAGKLGVPEYAETKRRFGWEFNGMRLHELYFENMSKGGSKLEEDSSLAKALVQKFHSLEIWEKGFKSVGSMRGIGWAILYSDPQAEEFFNVWVNEHDMGHLTGCTPLLVLDVFEHAYTLDYGIKKADYIEAFFKAIDWNAVGERFKGQTKGL